MKNAGSIFRILFHEKTASGNGRNGGTLSAARTAFYVLALSRGVFVHNTGRGFLSAAHTEANLTEALEAMTQSLDDVRDDGLFAPHSPH
ncbi:MAG: hypothetical protein RLN70_09310, partial [Rhodospirillaceae bacterium]